MPNVSSTCMTRSASKAEETAPKTLAKLGQRLFLQDALQNFYSYDKVKKLMKKNSGIFYRFPNRPSFDEMAKKYYPHIDNSHCKTTS